MITSIMLRFIQLWGLWEFPQVPGPNLDSKDTYKESPNFREQLEGPKVYLWKMRS